MKLVALEYQRLKLLTQLVLTLILLKL